MKDTEPRNESHLQIDTNLLNESLSLKDTTGKNESHAPRDTGCENESSRTTDTLNRNGSLRYAPLKQGNHLTCRHGRYVRSCPRCKELVRYNEDGRRKA